MHDREFELKTSRWYIFFILSILLININIILFLSATLAIKMILLFILVIYGVYLLRCTQAIIRIKRTMNGQWLLQTPKKVYAGKLSGDSTVTGFVSILRFKVDGYFLIKSYVVFRDSLPPDDYRRLRLMLRMY